MFLEGQDVDSLSSFSKEPEDAVDDPMETKDYEVTILTKQGKKRTITGTYDLYGLPEDWTDFIEELYGFICFYGDGEIFDRGNYCKPKRRKSDLIFCKVEFDKGGRKYTCLADTDEYREGDLVVVPVGFDNREAVVRIDSIEYCQPNEAPFPLEKTKHILRKYEKNNFNAGDVN